MTNTRNLRIIGGVGAAAALGLIAAGAQAQSTGPVETVVLDDFIGVVEMRTSSRSDGSVSVDPGRGAVSAPDVETRNGTLVIKGESRRIRQCSTRNGRTTLRFSRNGEPVALSELPRLTIEAPDSVALKVRGGAVFGEVGDLGVADIKIDGCGDLAIGDVANDAKLVINGSGDLSSGDVGGELTVVLNGSGDLMAGVVSGDLDTVINGSGDVEIDALSGGELEASIRGSGDVTVFGGTASSVSASIMGSGDAVFRGDAGDVSLTALGSGDVCVGSASGEVSRTRLGSGDIDVGGC